MRWSLPAISSSSKTPRCSASRSSSITVRTSNAEAWRSKTRWPRAADPLAWFPPDLRWSAAPNPWFDTASRPDSDGHAARTPTCGSSRTARPRSRSGANSAALQHGREELAQPRRPSAAPSVVQRCRQPCFTRSAVIGTSPASVPPCAGCGALAAPEPATTPDPAAEERNPRLAGRCSRRQKCSSFNESGAPACAAGSGGMEQPDCPSEGGVKLPRLLGCSSDWRGLSVRR